MKKVGTYIARFWYLYLFGVTSLVISVVLDMISPKITKSIIDDVIKGGKTELLTKLLLGIIIIAVRRAIFQYIKEYSFDMANFNITKSMRKDIFAHIQSLSVNYFDKTNTGELMARIKDDVDNIGDGMGYIIMLLIEVALHTTLV
ncbi:MAG: ABC transporter ATP-binding protein, partial [Lachnospiraceae bacterium]|nr:ABC transporter ATP-binding protein [Lachnospiraceae bacterium]